MMPNQRREGGFALLAALAACLLFAALAYQLIARSSASVALAQAELDRAQLSAAADAGLVLAITGLTQPADRGRWEIDARTRSAEFRGIPLRITVEDERGKIPVNLLDERQVERMFEAAGADRRQRAILTDSFLDWRDDDDLQRINGAETRDYAQLGYRARNGALRGVEELARLRGMTPAIYARLAPACTVFFGESGGFSIRNAQPLALDVMAGFARGSPAVEDRRRELSGQAPLATRATIESYVGRPLTIRIEARGSRGTRLRRATVVELTGLPGRPVLIRARL